MKALITKSTGKWYRAITETNETVDCRIKGKIRLDNHTTTNPIAVGDRVLLVQDGKDWMIDGILERKNIIVRQSPRKKNKQHIIAANIDQAVLVASIKHPRTSSGFIDRFLLTTEAYHIPAILVFNKCDLLEGKEIKKLSEWMQRYRNIGYEVYEISVKKGTGINALKKALKDKLSVLVGHSGVGKSSLANALDVRLDIKTKEISQKYFKGVHTTTFAEMHTLSFGGRIVDIPGIKEFGVVDFNAEEVSHYFPEMKEPQKQCQFSNCIHLNEPICGVKKAVDLGEIDQERYLNYLNIIEDIKSMSDY